jgi:tRNA1Val (adenine37-N6)-methyltransferase
VTPLDPAKDKSLEPIFKGYSPTTTIGTLLGGRVRYSQPTAGYRTGLEPVLLAAAIPAKPGDTVLECGTGAGAGLLCLTSRVPSITGHGLEHDPAMAALATENFKLNGFANLITIEADVATWQANARFDHAFANPPWHDAEGTASPQPGRRAAKQASHGLLDIWCATMACALRPRGTLTLILPAASLTHAIAALSSAKCHEVTVFPLWPRAGTPAKLLILQGIYTGRGPSRVLPGLSIHEDQGFTAEADSILRNGKGLRPLCGEAG